MASEHRLRVKTLVMVLVMVVCANTGDLLLKKGMTQIGAVQLTEHGTLQAFRMTVTSGTIWLAILFLLGFQIIFMTVVSWADYSYVMPVGAFGYATAMFLGVVVLGERVTTLGWFGVALICSGVTLVSRTKPRTTEVVL